MYQYRINQFSIQSDLLLPSDPYGSLIGNSLEGEPLQIRRTTEDLTEFDQAYYLARMYGGQLRSYDVGDGVLICAGDYMKMHINGAGDCMTFAVADEHVDIAGLFAIGIGISICTLLRGELPLHAACAEFDGHRFGVMAPSGTGKSTTLWALLKAGAMFANDDSIPIKLEGGDALAAPSLSLPAKAGREILERDGLDTRRYAQVIADEEKYWVPVLPHTRVFDRKPLSALFILNPNDTTAIQTDNDHVQVERQKGIQAMPMLMENLHGIWAVAGLLDVRRTLMLCTSLLKVVPVYTIRYPKRFDILPDMVQAMRSTLCTPVSAAA